MTLNPDDLLAHYKARRVVRNFTDEPVSTDDLWKIAQAGRWATSGGNRHVHRFLVVRDPERIRLVRSFAPGMLTQPPALVAICLDLQRAADEQLQLDGDWANDIDVGTAAMNMMSMAQALGLGTCPVTSYSRSGTGVMLGLPDHLVPQLLLMVGHPKPVERGLGAGAPKPITAKDLTWWETVDNTERPD